MFVHNYRTAAVWVQGHVGKKEMGREEGKPQVETRVRERGTETIAVFSDGTFGSNSRHYLK